MLRKLTIALAATLAIGAGVTATDASAAGRHGMMMHGSHGFHGFHHGFGFHGRFFGPGIGFYGYPYAYYGDDGCYQFRRVPTPWGWRLRRVWVCG
jgi:hypothetical protein